MIRYFKYGTYYTFKNLVENNIKYFNSYMTAQSVISFKKYNMKPTSFYKINKMWGIYTPYIKTLMIRGIGYRLFIIEHVDHKDNLLTSADFFENLIHLNEIQSVFSEKIIKSFGDILIYRDWYTNTANSENRERYEAHYKTVENSFIDEYNELFDFQDYRYIIVRSGDTVDNIIPVSVFLNIKGHKKERKLVISGASKNQVTNLSKIIYKMRPPSLYTGRGIKTKFEKIRKKKIRKTRAGGRLH